MESWSYVCEEKRFECDVIDSAADPLFLRKHPSLCWESINPSSFNENSHLSKITNYLELKLPDKCQKRVPHNPISDIIDSKFGDLPSSNALLGENKSTSELSGSVVASNSKEFPLSDLKLGTLADLREACSSKLSNEIVYLSENVAPQKRARVSKLNSQIAFCQVHGCNKDLSSSKDYHKKHKVCESHTKTEKVMVSGIEQRFCQQCSRFHLIAEFDDAKRSCRRRLAGHNERRRKPQVGSPSATAQRYLQSNKGNMYPLTTSTGTSLIFQDSGLLHSQQLHGMSDWYKKNSSFTSSSTIPPTSNAHLAGYDIGARKGPYPFDGGGFHASHSSASEVFYAESMIHDLPRISNSACARSLLSSSQQHGSWYGFSGLWGLVQEASTTEEQFQAASPILGYENNGNNFQINQGIEFRNFEDHFSL